MSEVDAGGGRRPASVADTAGVADVAAPVIHQLNVSHKSIMHIGPKFVCLTENVHAVEVVKETGLCASVREWARRSSRAERVACVAALLALGACAALLAGVLARRATADGDDSPDRAPHEWNVTREMWLARDASSPPLEERFTPPRLVIVQHSAGAECHRFADCAATMRHLQDWYLHDYHTDTPYNFAVGNDARVYEGRGWSTEGAHTLGYNRCSVGVGFVGDYRSSLASGSLVTERQLEAARRLLAAGVARGALHPRYVLLAASDVQATVSPGDRLLAALRAMPHAPADPNAYRDRSCDEIYAAEDKRAATAA